MSRQGQPGPQGRSAPSPALGARDPRIRSGAQAQGSGGIQYDRTLQVDRTGHLGVRPVAPVAKLQAGASVDEVRQQQNAIIDALQDGGLMRR